MTASYDPVFVVLSVIVAILASFAALDLAGRVRSDAGVTRLGWIAGGATVMGLGIWSMHFVGMLAFHLPSPISYDVPLMLLSVAVAIGASLLALVVINRTELGVRTILPAGVLMGFAIAGMHYIGMASMRMDARISYEPSLVALSVAIAIIASLAALWLAFRFRSDVSARGVLLKILSAMVMGVAISGMHYTAMAAARFAPGHVMPPSALSINATGELGGAIVAIAIVMIILALIGAVIDRSVQARAAFTGELSERAALLEKSERQYRLIVDTALDGVVTMSEAGLITDWNAQAERMFGWSRADAVGQRMARMIIPEKYRDAHERGLAHFLVTGEGPVLNTRIEITALRRDGAEFPVELAISPARVGSQWTFSAFLRDLTERNESAAALAAGEQRYRQLFENMPIGLYRSSPGGLLIDVNPAMASMLGYADRASLLATPATALYVDAADRARWSAAMADAGFVRNFVVRMRRADGKEIWARESTHAERGADGAIVLCEGSLEDITESLQAERLLQASERRLTQILEAVPVGIFVADASGYLVLGNDAARKIFGRGALSGLPIKEHTQVYREYVAGTDDLYPAERTPLARALAGEVASADDIEIHRDDGVISLSVQAAPIVDSEGTITAAVTVFTDTTERKSLESQLRQALKMEAIGQLAGGVAHDFNNLLTVILSTGAMLLERMAPSDPAREDVREINAAADRAAGLTRQLLAFSRKQVMQPRAMHINLAIIEIENMLRRLIREDIELSTDLDPEVATISADRGQIEQVLVNLIVNARDAMPNGGQLTISTANASPPEKAGADAGGSADKAYVRIAVTDSGVGMSREVQERLFDPFFTTKEPGQGTGLGLATVYGIVKQSGGQISVSSHPGRGTRVEVYLPRSTPALLENEAGKGAGAVPRGEETILLVEDDPSLRTLAARVLRKYGYEVLPAQDGAEALALAADPGTRIDAVVTDVVMPGMNGREVVERLLQLRPGIAYLFMSGYTDDDILKDGVLRGAAEFLQKPFTPDQLARKVRNVLGGRSSEVHANAAATLGADSARDTI